VDVLVYSGLELLGDGVMKLPFVRALRERWPEAHITWLAGKGPTVYARSLAPLVQGAVNAIVENAGIGSQLAELLRPPLRGRRFDLLIDTQRRVLTTLILRRIHSECFVSGAADFLLSDRKPPRGYRRPDRLIDQLFDLLTIAGGRKLVPDYALNLDPGLRRWAEAVLPPGPSYVGIAPGAGDPAKRWPRERFVTLAERQHQAGRLPVFMLGPAETDWLEDLREQAPWSRFPLQESPSSAEDAVSPLQTIALGERLAVAVANDSGIGHLLAASGCPMISLFGPTRPEKFAPSARRLTIIDARTYGASEIVAIPGSAVAEAVTNAFASP
jgi:ADP-heptose:LPS heptosyltransferase